MNKAIYLLTTVLALYMFSTLHPAFAEQLKASQNLQEIRNQIKVLSDSVAEIRRDQLNYKIEKDLLKETYSTNMTTVNFVITVILGTFAIFGYLGIKNIGTLKSD